jgi:hypothetical protein
MQTEPVARELLAQRGIDAGVLRDCHRHEFSDGCECHTAEFDNCFVHFHVGKATWKNYLPPEAPNLRIRSMKLADGTSIAKGEWFSC